MYRFEVNEQVTTKDTNPVHNASVSVFNETGRLERLFSRPTRNLPEKNPILTDPKGTVHFWVESGFPEKTIFLHIGSAAGYEGDVVKLDLSEGVETPIDSLLS